MCSLLSFMHSHYSQFTCEYFFRAIWFEMCLFLILLQDCIGRLFFLYCLRLLLPHINLRHANHQRKKSCLLLKNYIALPCAMRMMVPNLTSNSVISSRFLYIFLGCRDVCIFTRKYERFNDSDKSWSMQ